jgi:hypothetical protein
MDWFSRWPKDALVAVSSHFLDPFDIVCDANVKKQLIELMASVHDGVAENCVLYFQRFVTACLSIVHMVNTYHFITTDLSRKSVGCLIYLIRQTDR